MNKHAAIATAVGACLLLAVVLDKTPTAVLAQKKGLECGRGGPCPAGPEFIYKSGLTSAAERAWSKNFPVEDAADKAPTVMLKQLGLKPRYLDDDFGAASRKPVWASGNAYHHQPASKVHHYLDETSALAQRTQHHYLDEDSGPAARRTVWEYGRAYVKQPTSNPHHYLDFPSSSNSHQAKGKLTSLSGLEGQPAAPFGGQTFGHTKKGQLTSLSGLEGQPAAPFGGQTFGHTK